MDKIEIADLLFNQGFNCAQALVSTYSTELGLDRDTALRLASPFGGGIARLGDTCGAVTGALMIIGLKFGTTDHKDKEAKAKSYKVSDEFIERFKARNTSINCGELLGVDPKSSYLSIPGVSSIIKGRCTGFIRHAAEILEAVL